MSPKKVLITGASGVLGAAVYNAFKNVGHDVLGLAYSQSKEGLPKVNLVDTEQTAQLFAKVKPDWVIHCAAERRPDAFKPVSIAYFELRKCYHNRTVIQENPGAAAAAKLNEQVPGQLAVLCRENNATLVYISTDYVFDGTSPPYYPMSTPHPLQEYGKTKREGELAVLGVEGADVIILRVPVLYGPAQKNSDTAVNILLDIVEDQSGKKYMMDNVAIRYPTNVVDIAAFLVRLSESSEPLPPSRVIHFSADETFTKYQMCQVFGKILGLPIDHVTADNRQPTGAEAVTRPLNCQLSTEETTRLFGSLNCSKFEEWWKNHLNKVQ
ncbi:hypothetical protein F5I97DRAFT_1058161 [Phlebopus sp. FC_14]|nr:hypothetical protein F5I97DRAFT_1058161 [Phlebopus sp. FC_14]